MPSNSAAVIRQGCCLTLVFATATGLVRAQSSPTASSTASVAETAPVEGLAALTLAHAEDLLISNNRDLLASKRALETAKAGVEQADILLQPPTLSINSLSMQPGDFAHHAYYSQYGDVSYRLDQTFERGHKRRLRVAAAKSGVVAATADLHDSLRQQQLNLQSAYFDLLAAQDKEILAQQTAQFADQSLQATELRLQHGDVAASDLDRIRVDSLGADNDAVQAEDDREHAQGALAQLIAAEAQVAMIHAVSPWPQIRTDVPTVADAIDRRPDVHAAQARVELAQHQLEGARAEAVHDVTLGVQYEHYNGDQGTGDTVGVGISVPLYFSSRFKGDVHAAQVAVDAANDALERTRANARLEITQAIADLRHAAERWQREQDLLLPAARRAADSAEFAFSHGASSVTDLLDARRTYRAQQMDALDAEDDYAKARAELDASLTSDSDLQTAQRSVPPRQP